MSQHHSTIMHIILGQFSAACEDLDMLAKPWDIPALSQETLKILLKEDFELTEINAAITHLVDTGMLVEQPLERTVRLAFPAHLALFRQHRGNGLTLEQK